jgi:hypothetical protein
MAPTTRAAIVVLLSSMPVLAAGGVLVRAAQGMAPPDEPSGRTVRGRVAEILVAPCGTGNRRRTCYRPVVAYDDGGETRRTASRTAYGAGHAYVRGAAATVRVLDDGTAWIDDEWQARRRRARLDYDNRRRLPLSGGWLLVGCGVLGVLLAAGLTFWVDTSGADPAAPDSTHG